MRAACRSSAIAPVGALALLCLAGLGCESQQPLTYADVRLPTRYESDLRNAVVMLPPRALPTDEDTAKTAGPVVWRAASEPSSTVTLQQTDGLPESCCVLRTWTTESGQKARLLQSIDAQEMVTVVQSSGDKPGTSVVHVQIYRWGNSPTPPEGSPVPPTPRDIVVGPPEPSQGEAARVTDTCKWLSPSG